MKNAITIFTANLARELLHEGYKIIDIKPDRNDPDGKKSIFIFEFDGGILKKLESKRTKKKEENLLVYE